MGRCYASEYTVGWSMDENRTFLAQQLERDDPCFFDQITICNGCHAPCARGVLDLG